MNPFDLHKGFEFRQPQTRIALKNAAHFLPSFVGVNPTFCNGFNRGNRRLDCILTLRCDAPFSIVNFPFHA